MSSGSASSGGANAGDSVSSGIKGVFGATEDLRKGINNFFDNTIQPSAEKAKEEGVTGNHAAHTGSSAQETSGISTGTSTGTSSGFSKDAEALGDAFRK